jgi:hypothetical protein
MNATKISDLVIQKVVRENPGVTEAEMKKLLTDAYPFGERRYSPYQTWLRHCKRAMHELFHRNDASNDLSQLPLFREDR